MVPFRFKTLGEASVLKEIKKVNSGKSSGLEIGARILKDIMIILLKELTY